MLATTTAGAGLSLSFMTFDKVLSVRRCCTKYQKKSLEWNQLGKQSQAVCTSLLEYPLRFHRFIEIIIHRIAYAYKLRKSLTLEACSWSLRTAGSMLSTPFRNLMIHIGADEDHDDKHQPSEQRIHKPFEVPAADAPSHDRSHD